MAQAREVSDARHHVQFYENVSSLAEQIAGYLAKSLRAGGSAIAIARPLTVAAIELHLGTLGIEVERLRAEGKLVFLDALEVAETIVVDGTVDPERFATCVAARVRALCAAAGEHEVHAYGEVVDILWIARQRDAVLTLERLWSELLGELPFQLVCGYQLRAFDADSAGFDDICDAHEAVQRADATPPPAITTARALAQLAQRARALELEVARRTKLENRMLELLELSSQLAAADDRDRVAQLTIDHGMRTLGATDSSLWLLAPGGTHLQLIAIANHSGSEGYETIPLDGDSPVAHAVRSGESVFIGTLAEYTARFPASQQRSANVRTEARQAFAVLPLATDDNQPFGAVLFTFDHEREFADADRAFKAIFARQCALALARLQARNELELLYELTAQVNQREDLDDIYEIALQAVQRGAKCDRAAVLLFDPDGVIRFKASHGLSETYRRAVEGHTPWRQDDPAPVAIAVHDTETDPEWSAYRELFRNEGIRALAFVPVIHHRKLIGKFMLYRDEPCAFAARDLQFSATVAAHVAQAIERSRASAEERHARVLADEATRAREEILSVVSHDLRNPLGTIMMGASTLLHVDLGERSARIRSVGEKIHRQAERMARLIEDLVDFAGIQAGQLAIDRKPHKPDEIVIATSDIFSSLAQERGLRFEARVTPALPAVECDSERAVQVMSNLVANALKVTPRGGEISIGAQPRDQEIVFFVRDTGPGIAADEIPKLFERYWRSKHQQYKGAGLGLSIARGIVDAHGGRIWVESQVGSGTTFYFSLASLRNN